MLGLRNFHVARNDLLADAAPPILLDESLQAQRMAAERLGTTPLATRSSTLAASSSANLAIIDGVEHTVGPGGIASAPRGVPHAFKVSGVDGARLLCLHTPGCCQAFYRDASEPVSTDDSSNLAAGPVDMGRVQASARKNGGIEIIGPPPFTQPSEG